MTISTGNSTVNKVILIGNLGSDPELAYFPSGTAFTNFSLATERVWRDANGDKQERTDWHRISARGKLAENTTKYCKKGSKIYLEGSLQTRSWEDKDGIKHYITEVVADRIEFISIPRVTADKVEEVSESPKDDSLPF